MPPRRRVNPHSFFEPMYAPDPATPFPEDCFQDSDWDFATNKGPCRLTFSADALYKSDLKDRPFVKFEGITFSECDFRGKFERNIVQFQNCTFALCDFGGSEFHNDKFTSCTFIDTSFTLAKFFNCQIRNCKFERIGASGNETQLLSTDLTNPGEFIDATTTNLEHLPDGVRPEYQRLRLQQTKGTLSKVILHNLSKEGADFSYYDAVKSAQLHGALADRATAILSKPEYDREARRTSKSTFLAKWQNLTATASSLMATSEYWTLRIVGAMNGWGRSITRVFLFGILFAILLSVARQSFTALSWGSSILQTVEIFLVFGYTKYSFVEDSSVKSALDFLTAIVGLGWYAVAVATVISKVTKVR